MALRKKLEAKMETKARLAEGRRRRDQSPAQRWEYLATWIGKDQQKGMLGAGTMQRELNRKGAKGWELVSVYESRAVFKRPVDPQDYDAGELEELLGEDD